ncbi:MAG: FtsH protease activity modulator HflK, partial [Paracoccaceae bacterium]
MPYSSNSGGPWGGGGKKGGRGPWGDGGDDRRGGGDRPGGGPGGPNKPIPDIDEIVRKGQEQLKVLMGGRGGTGRRGGGGGGGPRLGPGSIGLIALVVVILWGFASFYRVDTSEKSVELFLGRFSSIGDEGLNFAPWPLVTKEVLETTTLRTEDIGVGGGARSEKGLMLTGDENIVDIDFSVQWNIDDPRKFLFNLADPRETVRAVSESAMREVIGQSKLSPILNRDRAAVSQSVRDLIQQTLDSYDSGINIVLLNFDKADPPHEVIDAFRDVQAAEQERDTLTKRADAYANQRLAQARGQSAQLLQEAEGYSARVVTEATG